MEGIQPGKQRLIYSGRSLDNEELTLSEYKIEETSVLYLVLTYDD